MEWERDKKHPASDEKNPKRRMKTPSQLEILERVYAEDKYPSEIVRAELSTQLNLTDRQLQMWFCHRRLKDRKGKDEEAPSAGPAPSKRAKKEKSPAPKEYPAPDAGEPPHATGSYHEFMASEEHIPYPKKLAKKDGEVVHKKRLHSTAMAVEPRLESKVEHRLEPRVDPRLEARLDLRMEPRIEPRMTAELDAIAIVESQLGEPLRDDGPILGYEFDPLPPGAFDTPIEPRAPRKSLAPVDVLHHGNKIHGRHEFKANKPSVPEYPSLLPGSKRKAPLLSMPIATPPQHAARIPREHQFIPEHPTGTQFYERNMYSKYERPSEMAPVPKVGPLSSGGYMSGNETYAAGNGYNFDHRIPNLGLNFMPPADSSRGSSIYSQNEFNATPIHRAETLPPYASDGQVAALPPSKGREYAASEKLMLFHEQERARVEKKRKTDEAKIAREIEAHEKRLRKEAERQEAMRRKKEEQERKELEKLNREKQKELDRIMRERAKEDEKMQREQKKEYERLEKQRQKERIKAEKLRQKEEVRREKEAAKLRAAYERATAKKLAKLSTGLMDDEQLELMQMSTFVQGLVSAHMDGTPLQGPDLSKVQLKRFPPTTFKMKAALSVPPWTTSPQNVANLFMVWRFLNTFGDVVGLWPFTLDEFVQALHDYDSRLLSEIHVALLKTLVKDVEDAAQAAATGAGGSQHAIAIAAGGHPHIVEAAYAWGFDIQEWGQHVSPLTWPEILRQFALAAGFGPKWKKRAIISDHSRDFTEGNECENTVANLRSGVAAANAVALMRGKNFPRMRRSHHRLTPGTVKYAAFHILSLQGNKGLTILELADRIQKSGLRDLSSSKTPEASISAALSRDTYLFERVAPSTYCVRAPFRKDPDDADEVLQDAKDKIHVYQSRLDLEEVEKDADDVEEVERDDEDEAEEQDVEDAEPEHYENPVNTGKVIFRLKEGKVVQVGSSREREKFQAQLSSIPQQPYGYSGQVNDGREPSPTDELGVQEEKVEKFHPEARKPIGIGNEDTEIDESQVGEAWVQGLMEGEHADLSVEERLNALVALVDVLNEGNAVRLAIEERYEGASAFKRQLWEEVQLDKRRLKEEQLLRSQPPGPVNKLDEGNSDSPSNAKQLSSVEAKSPALTSEDRNIIKRESETHMTSENAATNHKRMDKHDLCFGQDDPTAILSAVQSERSRAVVKADIRLRAEKLYVIRSIPLGLDRRHNRYWQFVTGGGGQDPGVGRIYFESSTDRHWEVIDTEQTFDDLVSLLDTRGTREAHLFSALKEVEAWFKMGIRLASRLRTEQVQLSRHNSGTGELSAVKADFDYKEMGSLSVLGNSTPEHSGAIVVELGRSGVERQRAFDRYKQMDKWLWSQCLRSDITLRALKYGKKRDVELLLICEDCHDLYWTKEKHCPFCHGTMDKVDLKYNQHVHDCEDKMKRKEHDWKTLGAAGNFPSRFQLLKQIMLSIEIVIPAEALKAAWTSSVRRAWCSRVKNATAVDELLQSFTELESMIHPDWLSSSYETAEQFLGCASGTPGYQTSSPPWVPHTTAAVALRVMAFDASLAYNHDQKHEMESKKVEEDNRGNTLQICGTGEVGEGQGDMEEEASSEEESDSPPAPVIPNGQPRMRGRGRAPGRTSGIIKGDVIMGQTDTSKRKLQFLESRPPLGATKMGWGRGQSRARGRGQIRVVSDRRKTTSMAMVQEHEFAASDGKKHLAYQEEPLSSDASSAEDELRPGYAHDWDMQDDSGETNSYGEPQDDIVVQSGEESDGGNEEEENEAEEEDEGEEDCEVEEDEVEGGDAEEYEQYETGNYAGGDSSEEVEVEVGEEDEDIDDAEDSESNSSG